MELFSKLFGSLLMFVYHCFDRVVINGYLSGLSRPEQVVYFFRTVLGISCITKEVLAKRTAEYNRWLESFALNHDVPLEWAEKGVRKEDHVQPYLSRMKRRGQYGVYFIFKSMEQGPTFRSCPPQYATEDPDYRILKKKRGRYAHYYFYILDEALGPIVMRIGSFLPFPATYWLNGHSVMEVELTQRGVTFRKSDNAFLSCSDPLILQEVADRLTPDVIRERLEYWTFLLGPKFSKREREAMNLSRMYIVAQIEYCRNFIFRRNFPIHKIFERSCALGLWRITTDRISHIFGTRITKKFKGKLHVTLEKLEHGHHTLRAYWKNSFVKQYEKFLTFLRQEVCCNNLTDFRLKKALENLPAIRATLDEVTDRFTHLQAATFNVHVDFSLFQRLALPIQAGSMKIPGIKIHDTRILRLMEVLLHAGTQLSGWPMAHIHQTVLTAFELSATAYTRSQLRYDIRKLKAHGLIQRHGNRYTYRLTEKGIRVAILFTLFHKRVCGPLANTLFHHQPAPNVQVDSQLQRAYTKADDHIQKIVDLIEAA
jgi:hypothetical protein